MRIFILFIISTLAAQDVRELEIINGTQNFRLYGKKGKEDKPWLDGRGDIRNIHCIRQGKCEKISFKTCFGAKIPYSLTSIALTESFSQENSFEKLNSFQALRHVPKCWSVVQPFLCAVFLPRCEKIGNNEFVFLPSLEMCKIIQEPCRAFYNTSYFPDFLKCNETLFPSKCNNDARDMKFNASGKCLEPLIPTEISSSYYKGIEGCGVQCKDPLYTDDEHRQIYKLIGWGATVCFLCNLFVIATFFIDWQNANKYPALIVFYINLCFLISCLGWLAQFTPGGKEDIVCRMDGTLRHSEPSAGENLSCIVVFVLVYYFLTAAMIWFVFLTYAWHLRAIGNVQDRVDKKGSYFHLVAWSLPLVLTITTMALSEVDGNSIVGVCFVGYINHSLRAALLLGPLSGVVLIGGFFIIRGMIMLYGLKSFANNIKSSSASNKIHLIIVRMGLCSLFIFVFILVTITCHINEFRNSNLWIESLRVYIICKISSTYTDEHKACKIENRPSVAALQLHLLCYFGAGIVMSSWCWTPSSIDTWKRYVRKKCGRDLSEDVKMQKHKVIAQTWAKRKEFEDKGRLSITLYNSHTDPVGLNFDVNDLNSSGTNEISSTWANYLPQFVKRRFALTGATTNSSSHGPPRKSSLDSEISFSVRHVSVESRRNSVDSQVSVKIAKMKTKVASRSRSARGHSTNSTKKRRFLDTGRKFSNRRESGTSVESQLIALKKMTYPNNSNKLGIISHYKEKSVAKALKRRSATAGLVEPTDINNFLSKNGKFIFPFLHNQVMETTSDEETSRASFKIEDSRLDIVLRQHDSTDDEKKERQLEEYILTDDENIKKQYKLNELIKSSSNDININRSSKERFESQSSRNSKNSNKSRNSRKSIRYSSKKNRKSQNKITKETEINMLNLNDTITSYSSELNIPRILNNSNSGLICDKTHSRNSKTSCDVGIQAYAHEIATQTMSSFNDNENKSDDNVHIFLRKINNIQKEKDNDENENEDNITESHQLLPKQNNIVLAMSESEKLKMLLLPSK